MHQREAQRLLWHTFFGRPLRAGTGAVEVGGAETFLDTGRLIDSNSSILRPDPRAGEQAADALLSSWPIVRADDLILHACIFEKRPDAPQIVDDGG